MIDTGRGERGRGLVITTIESVSELEAVLWEDPELVTDVERIIGTVPVESTGVTSEA